MRCSFVTSPQWPSARTCSIEVTVGMLYPLRYLFSYRGFVSSNGDGNPQVIRHVRRTNATHAEPGRRDFGLKIVACRNRVIEVLRLSREFRLIAMNENEITQYIIETFPGVETAENFGYTFFFYRSDHKMPFATMSASDNDYHRFSNLDRPGIFRLNIGVGKQTFQSLFGSETIDVSSYDFTVLDRIMPHPEYAAQQFICVLNPSDFDKVDVTLRVTKAAKRGLGIHHSESHGYYKRKTRPWHSSLGE